jgi:hypothetical protein
MHELPDDVVEGLRQLLPHERVVGKRLEKPVADAQRLEGDHGVVSLCEPVHFAGRQRECGQRALADDHRMDELDGDVPCVRPGLRGAADARLAARNGALLPSSHEP